ncbi:MULTISPECIES: YjbQ family protein [Eubacterium]|uniref:Secondary thiamine-phosphate synthase enzyme n=1 Tax=Eubacterium barkeri TaxID=1528 RepID=A0A1H3CL84_EUBBA|nr:YjbQ family protein [Eubacterium barkeri]SDX55012.1 secondary thiamine-phosphate synthase enzyme [Eubacterium barkeri]
MEILTFQIATHEGMLEITDLVRDYVNRNQIKDGLIMLQAPEKSVGITFADAADPNIEREYLKKLNHMLPKYDGMQFTGWSTPGIKAAFIGQSMQVMIQGGTLILGYQQGIFVADFAGPSDKRSLFISHIGTTLAEGEQAKIPAVLAQMNAQVEAEKEAARLEQERVIAEMREEYAKRQANLNAAEDEIESDRRL